MSVSVKATLLPNEGGVRYVATMRLGLSATLGELQRAVHDLQKAVVARSGSFGGHWVSKEPDIEIDPEGPDEWGYHKSATLFVSLETTALSQREVPPP